MSVTVANNSDNVINKLMKTDVESMRESVHIRRTGVFQSRTITVGDQECKVKQLITVLGEKIKNADIKQDEPHLEKLKEMLNAVSELEKADRGPTSYLFHLFSSRDKVIEKLDKTVTTKIEQHHVFKALEGGIDVQMDKIPAKFKNTLTGLYANSIKIKDDMHETRPIYLDLNAEKPAYFWAKGDTEVTKIQFYMSLKGTGSTRVYRLELKDAPMNGDKEVTINEVLKYLARIGTPKEVVVKKDDTGDVVPETLPAQEEI